MFRPIDPQSLFYKESKTSEYMNNSIKDWYGEDCLGWASDAEQQLNIPLSSWVSIDRFQKVTGRDLLRYNVSDFKRIVNDEYGPLFFKAFRKFVKERREDKALNKHSQQSGNLGMTTFADPLDSSTWTVPQLGSSELEVPQPYYGSSPSFSPSLSPSFSFDGGDSFGRREECTSTYFAQPAMLSGGTLSYGNCSGMTLNQDENSFESYDCNDMNFDENPGPIWSSEGSYPGLLPDFNSLMIKDGEDTFPNQLNIKDLDLSFKEETFNDLDRFIHSEDANASIDFESENGGIREEFNNGNAQPSQLSVPDSGTLEDCMLKKITTGKRGNRVRHPQSWEFLVRLLMSPKSNPSLIKWEDQEKGIFRLVQKEEIAKLWGKRSQKHKEDPLAYDNFARILRYHYKSKILVPVSDKHLVYQLGDKTLAALKKQGLV